MQAISHTSVMAESHQRSHSISPFKQKFYEQLLVNSDKWGEIYDLFISKLA